MSVYWLKNKFSDLKEVFRADTLSVLCCSLLRIARDALAVSLCNFFILIIFLIGCSYEEGDLEHLNSIPGENIIVAGDCRSGYSIFSDMIYLISLLDQKPEAVFLVGDLINEPGNMFEWHVFFETIHPLESMSTVYPVVGNHDVENYESQGIFLNNFNLTSTYYAIRIQDIFFIVLDSEEPGYAGSLSPAQKSWLENALISKPLDVKYTVVLVHRPLYPITDKIPLSDRDYYHDLFVVNGVDIVFASHEHLYYRQEIGGIMYITTGGAGTPLSPETSSNFYHFVRFSIWDTSLFFQIVRPNGKVFEEFEIPEGGK
jgi:Icc protein